MIPVIPLPALAVLDAALENPHSRGRPVDGTGDLQRHRTDRLAVEREPVGIGHEEFAARAEFHHGPVKDAAEGAENVILKRRGLPFNGVDTQGPGGCDRADGLPPGRQRVGIEKRGQHAGGRGRNQDGVLEAYRVFP